ncbi:MAG TPA: SDR family oxidoreductase [Polyangiaceae bacterium]|nr:SDR family oxidoreductase [Polyangiaceae bacterium]
MISNASLVMVVGGSSGIGLGVARAVVQRGGSVLIVGRSREKLEQAQGQLGSRARAIRADVTVESEVARLAAQSGAVDHLVVTAVAGAYAPIAQLELEAARSVIDSKLVAAMLLAKHVGTKLPAGGSITLTSGIAKDRPMPGGAMVAAVNGALSAFARALALELAPARVNVVSPGWVDTPVWDRLAGSAKQEKWDSLARRLPVGRIGSVEDLAPAYLFLMENGFTTGTTIHVDGGHALS